MQISLELFLRTYDGNSDGVFFRFDIGLQLDCFWCLLYANKLLLNLYG